MNKCLITKMKENVNNDILSKFGEIEINMKPVVGVYTTTPIYTKNLTKVEIVGNGHFNNDESLKILTGSECDSFTIQSSENTVLKMTSKYEISRLNYYGGWDNITDDNLSEIIKYSTNITELGLKSSNNVIFENLFLLKNITDLELTNTKAYGSLNTLLETYIENGRTSGIINIFNNTIITYKNALGQSINSSYDKECIQITIINETSYKYSTYKDSVYTFIAAFKKTDSGWIVDESITS